MNTFQNMNDVQRSPSCLFTTFANNKHLMTGPEGTVNFVSRESQCRRGKH